jgi:3-oxoacyl-[acyl-carrier-protein] synthase-3
MGVQVLATGSYVPQPVVTNADLTVLGFDAEWILQRTGIRERRHAPPGMNTSDMAVEAARRCIARAGVDPAEIDLVILGTFTSDMPVPATACVVQDRLGLNAAAMDLQSACAGFIYSLITGMQFVSTGCSKLALVIGADCNSRIVDRSDMKIYPLFGDGAGAVLLRTGSSEQGLAAYTLGADGAGAELLCRPMGGSRLPPSPEAMANHLHVLRMDGKAVFKWAIRLLEETVTDVLRFAELRTDQLDLVVLHQANIRIIDAAIEQLGISQDKVFNNLARYGNTSAGSVPLALDEAFEAGRIARGDHILLSGYGAGLAWGTAILKW